MKLVINTCHGGYSLSHQATAAYWKRKGKECFFYRHQYDKSSPYVEVGADEKEHWNTIIVSQKLLPNDRVIDPQYYLTTRPADRSDPDLVAVVEQLGRAADGEYAKLKVVEIPDGIEYTIEEYDGLEHVAEKHSTWD